MSCIESNFSSITVQWADIGLSMDSWTLETYPEEVAGNLTAVINNLNQTWATNAGKEYLATFIYL